MAIIKKKNLGASAALHAMYNQSVWPNNVFDSAKLTSMPGDLFLPVFFLVGYCFYYLVK